MPSDQSQTNAPRYFLGRDNSAHWYIVQADKRSEWDAWCNIPEDDELSWVPPELAGHIEDPPNYMIAWPSVWAMIDDARAECRKS